MRLLRLESNLGMGPGGFCPVEQILDRLPIPGKLFCVGQLFKDALPLFLVTCQECGELSLRQHGHPAKLFERKADRFGDPPAGICLDIGLGADAQPQFRIPVQQGTALGERVFFPAQVHAEREAGTVFPSVVAEEHDLAVAIVFLGDTQSGILLYTIDPDTQSVRIWCGLAFERVALQHEDQIKRKLGISGVVTRTYGWRHVAEGEDGDGAQVDLVLDRNDRVVNICEVKYRRGEEQYVLSDDEDRNLVNKREAYIRDTGTTSAVHLTMVTVNGVRHNAAWNDIQSEVTLDDLFKE